MWYVVSTIDMVLEKSILYQLKQRSKAVLPEDSTKSTDRNTNCAGAILGILIWMTMPTPVDCSASKFDELKFLCDWKHKYDMN